jgi:hypothetical protein
MIRATGAAESEDAWPKDKSMIATNGGAVVCAPLT